MVLCAVNIDDAIETMMAVYYKYYLDQVAYVLVHRNLIVDIDLVVVVACNFGVFEDRKEGDSLFRLQSNSLYPNYRNQLFLYVCII